MNLLDLHHAVGQLKEPSTPGRIQELVQQHPGVHLCAVGGFPFWERVPGSNCFLWCGTDLTPETAPSAIQDALRSGLGLSAVLTHMNTSRLSLNELGDLCAGRQHDWAYNWMTLSLAFIGNLDPEADDIDIPLQRLDAQMAFARDRRFWLSWPIGDLPYGGDVFVATASVRDWMKVLSHADDTDFDRATRAAMRAAKDILDPLLPLHREQHYLNDTLEHERALSTLPLSGRRIIEIGAGRGALTDLLLRTQAAFVYAFEIDADREVWDARRRLHPINQGLGRELSPGVYLGTALTLFEGDARTEYGNLRTHVNAQYFDVTRGDREQSEFCLVSNPPYSLLDWISNEILPWVHDALLLIPLRLREDYPDFSVVGRLDGRHFTPRSEGHHLLIQRGFDR